MPAPTSYAGYNFSRTYPSTSQLHTIFHSFRPLHNCSASIAAVLSARPNVMPRLRASYKPLTGPSEIRVLEIGPSLDPFHHGLPIAKLVHTELGNGIPFAALSYVWGTEYDPMPLICDGVKVRITKNLGQALRQLQAYTGNRGHHVWVDAICIDQECVTERNQQVALMKDIYGTAKEVLIWLGPDEGNRAQNIFDMVSKTLDELVEAIHSGIEPENTGYWLPSPEAESRLRQLDPLLQREWFTRTWTIQEAGLTDRPLAIWGEATLDLNKICLVCMMFLKYVRAEVEKIGLLREMEMITNLYQMYLPSAGVKRLHYVLHQARPCKATDARDKIYAFLSHAAAWEAVSDFPSVTNTKDSEALDDDLLQTRNLALILSPGTPADNDERLFAVMHTEDLAHEMRPVSPDQFSALRMLNSKATSLHGLKRYHHGRRSFITPDYRQSLVTVYRDLAMKIIQRTESLEILSFVQHDAALPSTGPDFPSWIPRWDVHNDLSLLGKATSKHFASANRRPVITPSPDPGVLTVRGLFFDRVCLHTITLKRDDFLNPAATSPLFAMASRCRVAENPVPEYPRIVNTIMSSPDRIHAYQKTFTAGSTSSSPIFDDDLDFFAYQQEFVDRKARKGKYTLHDLQILLSGRGTGGDARRYANAAAEACHGRRFFITKAGFFGVGPGITEEDDIVCVLLGSDVPVILREKNKVGYGSDGYAVVGECYVHGIMCGETVRAWGGPDGELRDINLC